MNTRLFSQIISFIFHPMVFSLGVFYLLLFQSGPPLENSGTILFICFIFSNLIPITTVLLLKKLGKITDLDASQKEQRSLPLTLGIIYAGIAYLILNTIDADPLVKGLMFCYMTNSVLIILITRYWKISIHAWGVGAPLAALWIAGFHYFIPAVSILTAVSYARVVLKAHTILQVVIGSILGVAVTYIQLILFFI